MNLILMNKHEGMPEIAPDVQMLRTAEHSLSVITLNEDLVLHEGTRMDMILLKEHTTPANLK